MKMIITAIKVALHFDQSRSLKDKRRLLKSIMLKVKQRFNVSVAEIADQDLWQKATIGICYPSITKFQAEKLARTIENYIITMEKGTISQYDNWIEKVLED